MNGFALVLVTAALGVDYGWQPGSDGRLEYIIQLEPVTLIALREGQDVISQIDPYVGDVRRFRIRVGSDLVPRVGGPATGGDPRTGAGAPQAAPQAGVSYDSQPVDDRSVEFIVQLSPERIVLLKNGEHVVGEIPAGIQNVSRFRIRSAAAPLAARGLDAPIGQPSGVTLAGAEESRRVGQTSGGTRAAQAPGASRTASPVLGQAAPGVGAAASPRATTAAGVAQPTPVVGSPSRMSSAAAAGASPPTPPLGQTGAAPYQPPQGPTLGHRGGQFPVQAETNASQSNSRTISTPDAGPTGNSGYGTNGSDPPAARGGSWQQQTPQPDNSGGWSAAVDWPPPASASGQGTGEASSGIHSHWDAPSPPENAYAGTPPNRAAPPAQAADRTALPAGPAYSPFASTGSPSGGSYQSLAGSNTASSPHGQPTIGASQNSSGYGTYAPALRSAGRDATQPSGAEMFSIVSLSTRQPSKASPMDFWNSLAETADDPDLAYLRDDARSATEEAWWPLTLAMLALFASLGGNLYMGWIAVDVYRRYLDAAGDDYEDDDPSSSEYEDDRHDDWTRDRGRRREMAATDERAVA